MFYHKQCNRIVDDYKDGIITKDTAFIKLHSVEKTAYKVIPNAEPDGDITYAVVCAVEKIYGIEERANKPLKSEKKAFSV